MKGRKPKPTQALLIEGNFRADRHGKRLEVPEGCPEPPPFLQGTAKKEWIRIVPELAAMGILHNVDQAALGIYCQARADYSWSIYKIRREGRIVTNAKTGVSRVHPAIRIQKEAAEVIRKYAVEFGLTPSARGRLHTQNPDTEDPEDADFFG